MNQPAKICLNTRVRYRAVGEDGVLVHLDDGEIIVVNEVGFFIIQQLDQPRVAADLVAAVIEAFNVTEEQAMADVDAYLQHLESLHLIGTGEGV